MVSRLIQNRHSWRLGRSLLAGEAILSARDLGVRYRGLAVS